ncbi:MAG: 50S ribosomal protein L6 [Candidatus Peregrinibacteria bacterium]
MSRIGRLPVAVPSGITIEIFSDKVVAKGAKGTLEFPILSGITVIRENDTLLVGRLDDEKKTRGFHGLTRAMIANMIVGVATGFEKRLEIIGVGYRAVTEGKTITLSLGFSHPVIMEAPEGVQVDMEAEGKNKNIVVIRGIDKQAVGQFAADIRKLRKPEPYKGKGVRYKGEFVRRKAGKSSSRK